MKKFMLNCVLSQDYSDVDPSLVRNFIERENMEAGLCLLAIGAYKAAQEAKINSVPLGEVYADIYNDGRLHSAMPQSPATIIKHKLGHIPYRVEMLGFLRSELQQRREQSVA